MWLWTGPSGRRLGDRPGTRRDGSDERRFLRLRPKMRREELSIRPISPDGPASWAAARQPFQSGEPCSRNSRSSRCAATSSTSRSASSSERPSAGSSTRSSATCSCRSSAPSRAGSISRTTSFRLSGDVTAGSLDEARRQGAVAGLGQFRHHHHQLPHHRLGPVLGRQGDEPAAQHGGRQGRRREGPRNTRRREAARRDPRPPGGPAARMSHHGER